LPMGEGLILNSMGKKRGKEKKNGGWGDPAKGEDCEAK